MAIIGRIPRRCVNLPSGALRSIISCTIGGRLQDGPAIKKFYEEFGDWLGGAHVYGAASGRSAFQLALEALDMEKGKEIIFPMFTFPVMPMVAKMLGYKPVFCEVDPESFNAGPEHIEAKINENTGAVLATHLFGRPCPIKEIAKLTHERGIRLLEDCAHACGVRVDGRLVGTFSDVGIFSFAEGKNMPCLGGGAIATTDAEIARRAAEILEKASVPDTGAALKQGIDVWLKWLLTRPEVFGLTVYPALRLKLALGQPLLDSAVGEELLDSFAASNPQVVRFNNLQAEIGLRQIKRIDRFNEGARKNAHILTESLANADISGISVPGSADGENIFVYYPLKVDPTQRDDLRRFLLKEGFDTKITDMSDCSLLKQFRDSSLDEERSGPREASLLEICVYPVISESSIRQLARAIQSWAQQS
jgi:dTDP-4-amino-4,6-dideoxygalactose transaminase